VIRSSPILDDEDTMIFTSQLFQFGLDSSILGSLRTTTHPLPVSCPTLILTRQGGFSLPGESPAELFGRGSPKVACMAGERENRVFSAREPLGAASDKPSRSSQCPRSAQVWDFFADRGYPHTKPVGADPCSQYVSNAAREPCFAGGKGRPARFSMRAMRRRCLLAAL